MGQSAGKMKWSLGVLFVALAASVVLSGCVISASSPTFANTSLGAARVQTVLTSGNFGGGETQTLEEYGIFYSTSAAEVAAVDSNGSAAANANAIIVAQPGAKRVSYQTAYVAAPGEVGTITVNLKGLAPGTTYYYRLYTIGKRDSNGARYVTLHAVNSHATSDPTLKSLAKSKGSLSPGFSKVKYAYTNTISRATSGSRITVVPTLSGSSVQMKIGSASWSVARSKLVSVSKGHSKVLTVRVTAPDGIVANYTITVKRK